MRHRLVGLAVGLSLACFQAGSASAAQLTDRVQFLHADGEIGYEGTFLFGTLREDGTEVARYRHSHHRLNIDVEFGAAPRTEVYVRLPIVLQDQLRYVSAQEMTYNPDTGLATMVGGTAIEEADLLRRERAGFGDMWIGVQATPISEVKEKRWNPSPAGATVLLELGVKLPTGRTLFDEPSESGKYGPGSGGADLLLGAAFSKRLRSIDPYVAVTFVATGAHKEDLKDASGEVVFPDAPIDPADTFDVAVGMEVLALESRETRRRVSVDLGAGWTYYTWGTQQVGTVLPSFLAPTDGFVSTESAYMSARAGFGLYFQPAPVVQIRLNAELLYPFSHVVERVDELNYQVESGYDSIQLKLGFTGAGTF